MSQSSRRNFMKTSAAIAAGYWVSAGVSAQESSSANEEINFACIGVGGKGSSDSADAAKSGNIVALCDVDQNNLDKQADRLASRSKDGIKKYSDYRKMFDEVGKTIDAVTISTPDHNHTPAAILAMNMGIHTFCQKPMTRTIYEARLLGNLAREKKVATQMGNQGTAGSSLREAAAQLKAGAIGNPKELHVWTNRPVWPQGLDRPEGEEAPETVNWDAWIGPAKMRPFSTAYHPFKWRGWWDFGTGALGDMACHTFNLPFMGLDLKDPTSVVAETSGHNKETYPKWSVITFEFPKTNYRGPIKVYWYDGGKLPDKELFEGENLANSGCLVVGESGKLYSPGDYGGSYKLLGAEPKKDVEYPRSPGHFQEFVRAIQGGEPAMSNFPDYAGPLTETILLGNLAVWADGEKVGWDAKTLTPSDEKFMELVKPTYRDGYSLEG